MEIFVKLCYTEVSYLKDTSVLSRIIRPPAELQPDSGMIAALSLLCYYNVL